MCDIENRSPPLGGSSERRSASAGKASSLKSLSSRSSALSSVSPPSSSITSAQGSSAGVKLDDSCETTREKINTSPIPSLVRVLLTDSYFSSREILAQGNSLDEARAYASKPLTLSEAQRSRRAPTHILRPSASSGGSGRADLRCDCPTWMKWLASIASRTRPDAPNVDRDRNLARSPRGHRREFARMKTAARGRRARIADRRFFWCRLHRKPVWWRRPTRESRVWRRSRIGIRTVACYVAIVCNSRLASSAKWPP